MKKIYLIRHGQTEYNRKGIVQGRGINTSLNELGVQQAYAFFEKYRDVPFKKVYSSSLNRAIQTIKPFVEMGIAHEILPGLDEISWGVSEGKEHSSKDNSRYSKVIKEWQRGLIEERIRGGESPLDVQRRQKVAIDYILSKKDEDVVLVCMHGRAMRILLAWVLGRHLKEMDTFEHDNLSLYILKYSHSTFSIDIYNDKSHLIHLTNYGKTG